MTDQYTFTDPVSQYRQDGFPEQDQDAPGLASDLTPTADHGEETYRGSGRLTGRKALPAGMAAPRLGSPLLAAALLGAAALAVFGLSRVG